MFRFRQFSINDDHCAMKVGTDGVLLGAWCTLPPPVLTSSSTIAMPSAPLSSHRDFSALPSSPTTTRILDIGTGSGLIALMLAQRFPQTTLLGIEIDKSAAQQAQENVQASPFSSQINILEGDVLKTEWGTMSESTFDMIVSNPPYFEETLLSPNSQRAQARHVHLGLTFERLTERCAQLLRTGGWLQVILPKQAQERFVSCAARVGLQLIHQTDVHTVKQKPAKRVLLRLEKVSSPPSHTAQQDADATRSSQADTLILLENGKRSAQYEALCSAFYLPYEELHPKTQ